jgi:16S rRNA (guanine527-N7)-methyltransferase
MEPSQIADLLAPFLDANPLPPAALNQISTYIDLLLRWNARINLTAVRTPEEIVTRHFGESLFAARHLLPGPEPSKEIPPSSPASLLVDLGSGAGFPGLPMRIWSPHTKVTLIESNHKKVVFLREIIRALTLTSIDVFAGRAEHFPPASATLVTLRAVERFEQILPTAATFLAPQGRLALFIGHSQVVRAQELLPALHWTKPIPIPHSDSRVLLTSTPEPSLTKVGNLATQPEDESE